MTKAVIPAAGLGTRFLPASKAVPKEMLPLVDKPAIQYVVEEAVNAGIRDILIITGRNKGAIEDHFDYSIELDTVLEAKGKHDLLQISRDVAEIADLHFIRQGQPHGLGHAVWMAREHVGREPFAVMLGDDVMDRHSTVLADMVKAHDTHDKSVVALLEVAAEEISAYGCADVEPLEDPLVTFKSVVEKPAPEDAPSNLAVIGRYILNPEIFDALEEIEPGAGGELQLTDAIDMLVRSQGVLGYTFSEGRYDVGKKLDFLRATVELALDRDDMAEEFRAYLKELVARPGF